MACVSQPRNIRSSFDLGWGGVSHAELANSIAGQRTSMQLDQEIQLLSAPLTDGLSKGEQLLPFDPAEIQLHQLQQALLLQQAQQQAVADDSPSEQEMGIDAQIQRLLQLKQFIRRTKQASAQQQQQQVILEDMALANDAANVLDASASALFASNGMVTPMQSESLLMGPELSSNSWSNLAAARAAAQPSRRSVDMGGLAQQLAALEMSNNAAAAALAESQGLAGMRTSVSFTAGHTNAAGLNNRLSLDCGAAGMPQLTNDDLIAAAAMAAAANAQAEAASRRTSLCMAGPQMPGLLDNMLMDPRQSLDMVSAAGAALALQSSLYAPAAPALDAQLQAPVATTGLAGLGMPSPAAMAMQMSPARHSLDCSLLSPAGLGQAALGHMAGLPSPGAVHPSAMPSPVHGRASLNLPQAPLLGDRGVAMAQAAAQAQNDAAGWGFSARRAGGRASMDVRRVSSELPRTQTPGAHVPPRKSVSAITSGCSSGGSTTSTSSSGRSSPRSNKQQAPAQAQASRRASMDRPPTQPPKWSPSASSLGKTPQESAPAAASPAPAASTAVPARRGTGVFIPSCMIKS